MSMSQPMTIGDGASKSGPFFPELVDCQKMISSVLAKLSASGSSLSLHNLFKAKKITTVGDFARLSEEEVQALPIKQPKIPRARNALVQFLASTQRPTMSLDRVLPSTPLRCLDVTRSPGEDKENVSTPVKISTSESDIKNDESSKELTSTMQEPVPEIIAELAETPETAPAVEEIRSDAPEPSETPMEIDIAVEPSKVVTVFEVSPTKSPNKTGIPITGTPKEPVQEIIEISPYPMETSVSVNKEAEISIPTVENPIDNRKDESIYILEKPMYTSRNDESIEVLEREEEIVILEKSNVSQPPIAIDEPPANVSVESPLEVLDQTCTSFIDKMKETPNDPSTRRLAHQIVSRLMLHASKINEELGKDLESQ